MALPLGSERDPFEIEVDDEDPIVVDSSMLVSTQQVMLSEGIVSFLYFISLQMGMVLFVMFATVRLISPTG